MNTRRTRFRFLDDEADHRGRRRYVLAWHDGVRCRGQVFFGEPPEDAMHDPDPAPCEPCFLGTGACTRMRCPDSSCPGWIGDGEADDRPPICDVCGVTWGRCTRCDEVHDVHGDVHGQHQCESEGSES